MHLNTWWILQLHCRINTRYRLINPGAASTSTTYSEKMFGSNNKLSQVIQYRSCSLFKGKGFKPGPAKSGPIEYFASSSTPECQI